MTDNTATRPIRRKVFMLRMWQHGRNLPDWVSEIQDVTNGEVTHLHGLDALFEYLRQKTAQVLEAPRNKENSEED
ncbi:MAG: hypothetical protein EHM70_08530 [Chloroflexota bacterium]|nr:MAG: hypothetical protein EHM70_08530 [Chloroflexota bacterium]